MKSEVGLGVCEIDPKKKYYKAAGFKGKQKAHYQYIEEGRRPWLYRNGGAQIVNFDKGMPYPRLCAHRGFNAVAPENSMPAYGAAIALGAQEIEFDLWTTKDGVLVSCHDNTLERVSDGTGHIADYTYEELLKFDFCSKHGKSLSGLRIPKFEDVLRKFSCHTIMNVHVKSRRDQPWDEKALRRLIGLIDAYDARGHVYFMSENLAVQKQLAALAPDIPRCMGHDSRAPDQIVERAIAHGCKMVQFFKPHFSRESVDKAHAAGLRCNVFFANDAEEAKNYFKMGIDTVLTDDYHLISAATGVR
jgi:glycerophosphoryl diester phosphodiesterase